MYLIAATVLVWPIAWAESWLPGTTCIAVIFALFLLAISSAIIIAARFALTEIPLEEASTPSIGISATWGSIIASGFTPFTRLFAILALLLSLSSSVAAKAIATWPKAALLIRIEQFEL